MAVCAVRDSRQRFGHIDQGNVSGLSSVATFSIRRRSSISFVSSLRFIPRNQRFPNIPHRSFRRRIFPKMSSRGYRSGAEAKYADTVGLGADEDDDEDEDGGGGGGGGGGDYPISSSGGASTSSKAIRKLTTTHGGEEGLSISATTFIAGTRQTALPGGPFSAVTPSMWPQDILARIQQLEECRDQPEYRYDEFGFKVEVEDGPEQCSNKILSTPFIEDPQHRLKWIAYLEFTHNQVVEDLTWDKIDPLLPKSDKLAQMIRAGGVPHSLRAHLWPRLCGSILKKQRANFSYKELVKSANKDRPAVARQIEKDLLRTMPNNACFMHMDSTGVPRLRRILRALAYLYPEIGYCQGMGVIVGTLLLFLEEEETFWIMVTVIEDYLPASYFSQSLLGLQADQRALRQLIGNFLPDTDAVLTEHDIEMSLISLHWFLTLFANVLHIRIVLRLWDLFFYEGSCVMFRSALGMMKIRERELKSTTNSADIFNLLSDLPGSVDDADYLLDISYKVAGSLNDIVVASHRKKHLAYLMVDQGVLVGNPERTLNLPKERINRRKLKRSQSLVSQIFSSGGDHGSDSTPEAGKLKRGSSYGFLNTIGGGGSYMDCDDAKLKNVRQTELMVDLKEAILKVARHFLTVDPSSHQRINLQPDYSLESHAKDHENYLAVHRSRRKRARALLDFERHDDDELGFRRNDIITIVSQKDEHCWIGELNGLRGWFPAKFVELLDERSKQYTCLGDDTVSEAITDLVRGGLCSTLKSIFEHGIKRPTVLGGPCHPWLFIEDIASEEVRKDFRSVYSRLVLCKTYRLDEDGKVLTPEELLYKSVQQVNFTHDPGRVQMDVKFRSLVSLGLNEQALHLWFELLCSNQDVVRKWYQPWSFIRSPGWVQIKCELRLLSQFAFSLSCDWELPPEQRQRRLVEKPLKEGVRDMLVKHHLFSWDL